jgi:hypothetical protein
VLSQATFDALLSEYYSLRDRATKADDIHERCALLREMCSVLHMLGGLAKAYSQDGINCSARIMENSNRSLYAMSETDQAVRLRILSVRVRARQRP